MEASRDQNHVTTILCALSSNGTTPVRVEIDPDSHALKVDDASTGSSFGGTDAIRDQNRVPVWLAVSSSDEITPVPVFANSDGELLIDSN